ncbi:MAG: DNA-directed RNA polymerase subunit alpha [Candidatus Jacksonbacteria bacterium]|nr:DNA-directed RNA polymerase subunit alpha [Candidatus Jacksonbacteria bacterium]
MKISLPSSVNIIPSEKNQNSARVEIAPLHPGYGHTIGNALRRVLLSSLEGAGITSVKIQGAHHEFMTLPHIKEEVLEIILNLKQVRLKLHTEGPETLILEIKGKKDVTAADFKKNPNVEVANKDMRIATLTHKDAELVIEATVKKGLGFSPIEEREKDLEVGVISIDTVFSPIVSVGYSVEDVRVGKRTDYDKLVLDITTNGTIGVESAVHSAANILEQYISFIKDQTILKTPEKDDEKKEEKKAKKRKRAAAKKEKE